MGEVIGVKPIVYTEYGLANSYDDRIELNKSFNNPEYVKIKKFVLRHEQGHTSGFDLKHEIKDSFNLLAVFGLVLFILIHPKTWIDFSPVWKRKDELFINYELIVLYGALSILGIIAYIKFF